MKLIRYSQNKFKLFHENTCNSIFIFLNIFITIILLQNSNQLLIKSRSLLENNNQLNCKIKKEEENPNTKVQNPLSLNITYEHPYHDIDEQRKYADEHIAFIRRTRDVENKLNREIENLKMILNVQNIQLQKINEIFYTNLAVLYQKLANDYSNKYIENRLINGFKHGEEIAKKKLSKIKVDFNDTKSVDDFKDLLVSKGVVKPEALGGVNEGTLYVNGIGKDSSIKISK